MAKQDVSLKLAKLARELSVYKPNPFVRMDGGYEFFIETERGRAVLHLGPGVSVGSEDISLIAEELEQGIGRVVELFDCHYVYAPQTLTGCEPDIHAPSPTPAQTGGPMELVHQRALASARVQDWDAGPRKWEDVLSSFGLPSSTESVDAAESAVLALVAMHALATDLGQLATDLGQRCLDWEVSVVEHGSPEVWLWVYNRTLLVESGGLDIAGVVASLAEQIQRLPGLEGRPPCPLRCHEHELRVVANRVPAWVCPITGELISPVGQLGEHTRVQDLPS